MKKYRDMYYEITETHLTYIIELYFDREKEIKVGSVELYKAGIIGDVDFDRFAKECIDDIDRL